MKKPPLEDEFRRYLAKLGSKGGKATAQRMTKDQRIARARKAGRAHGKKKVK
jgi:hypothetical protein